MTSALQTATYTKKDQLNEINARLLAKSPETQIKLMKERLEQIHKRLSNNSLEAGLKRGFVLMQNFDGKYITRKTHIGGETQLKAIFADGDISVEVI